MQVLIFITTDKGRIKEAFADATNHNSSETLHSLTAVVALVKKKKR